MKKIIITVAVVLVFLFGVLAYRFLMFRATPKTLKFVHGIDEQVAVEEYLQAIRFYHHLIRRPMAGRE